MTSIRLSLGEVRSIREHNNSLIEAAESALMQLRQIPRSQRPLHIAEQVKYWTHVKSALNWSTELAEQRLAPQQHGNRSTV